MAYSGFLLKIGNYTFPEDKIALNTYSPYVNMQDVDPWTDENGELHLVDYKKHIVLFAKLNHTLDKVEIKRHNAALTLHELHHNRTALIFHKQGFNAFYIVCLSVQKALCKRIEILVEHVLSCGGQGGQGSAVEAVFQGDDIIVLLALVNTTPKTGNLNGTLISLSA